MKDERGRESAVPFSSFIPHPSSFLLGLAAFSAFAFAAFNWTYDYVIALQNETTECFFMFGHEFLLDFPDHPGGLLRYAGRFLGQFYHYPWLGAVVVSACITCFGALFYGVLRKLRSTAGVGSFPSR